MRRRSKAVIVALVAVPAFLFLAPILQVDFVITPPPSKCPSSSGGATRMVGCFGYYKPGYSSVTYRVFGIGGTYDNVNSTGYSLAIGPTPTVLPPPDLASSGGGGLGQSTGSYSFTAPSFTVQISAYITPTDPPKAVAFSYAVYLNPQTPESAALCQKTAYAPASFSDSCSGLAVGRSYEVLISATNCYWQVFVEQ